MHGLKINYDKYLYIKSVEIGSVCIILYVKCCWFWRRFFKNNSNAFKMFAHAYKHYVQVFSVAEYLRQIANINGQKI